MMDLKVSVELLYGSKRDIADRARTTIGLDNGTKEVSDDYIRRMYLCEHSPIRTEMYKIRFENLPTWVSTHFVRHKIGVEHFVSTQRTDRTGEDRNSKSQSAPVIHEMILNSQAIINISRKRLCKCASKETTEAWIMALNKLENINKPLYSVCVPDCIYRGHCYEHKTCKYFLTNTYIVELEEYRENINGFGEE